MRLRREEKNQRVLKIARPRRGRMRQGQHSKFRVAAPSVGWLCNCPGVKTCTPPPPLCRIAISGTEAAPDTVSGSQRGLTVVAGKFSLVLPLLMRSVFLRGSDACMQGLQLRTSNDLWVQECPNGLGSRQ